MCEQQLDYDSKVVQKKFYHDALLEITLPVVIKRMDNKWRTVGGTIRLTPPHQDFPFQYIGFNLSFTCAGSAAV